MSVIFAAVYEAQLNWAYVLCDHARRVTFIVCGV